MSRQTRRRRPRRCQEPAPARVVETPANWERFRQVYACMKGRSVVVGWASIGIKVEASTPEELAERTDATLIERAKRQQPS